MTETEILLTHIRKCRRVDLYVDAPPLSDVERNLLHAMKERRRGGVPLQYIVGQCEFLGLTIFVDERALIPRPETELLADKAIERCGRSGWENPRILDIGTGSGNLAVALAKHLPRSFVTALDISQAALDLAAENAKINSVDERIIFIRSDVFSTLRSLAGFPARFDLIVANPPYIPSGELPNLPVDVRKEPVQALDGGTDGLQFYRRIIAEAPEHLEDSGALMMEFGDGQATAIKKLFEGSGKYSGVRFYKDLNGKHRFLVAESKNPWKS